MTLALPDLRGGIGRLLFAAPFYRLTLGRRGPAELLRTPPDPWPGDAARGGAIARGASPLDATVRTGDVWRPEGATPGALAALHGFDWLRDLKASGGDAARKRARALTAEWLAAEAAPPAIAWRPDVMGRRLYAWLGQHDFFCAPADDSFRRTIYAALAQQARHLGRTLPVGVRGEGLFLALKALVTAGLALPGRAAWTARALSRLERATQREILPDGGHLTRNPTIQAAVLRHLVDIRNALLAAGEPVPPFLIAAIDRAAPVVRMLRHGDGRLALFNGATEGEDWAIDMLLAQADARGRAPASAPHSGWERLSAGRTVVLVDAGAPPAAGWDATAHVAPLALEISAGRERLVTSCGALADANEPWASAQRSTAAHSTLIVDETNAAATRASGVERRPTVTIHRREEADGDHWLDLSHDGYVAPYGLEHRRALWLARSGDDIRGAETLTQIPGRGRPARGWVLRFHLAPGVRASLAQDGQAVLLRLPSGRGWRLRAKGGSLGVAESVYLGGGAVRRTEQVLVTGTPETPDADNAVTHIQWSLQRIAADGAR